MRRHPFRAGLRRIQLCLAYFPLFCWEVVISALRVAFDVLTPTHHMRPAVVGVPLDATTDAEIALLAVLVTLTPGTLALDVSLDRKVLYVHAMYAEDPEQVRREVKTRFERRVLEILR